MMKTKRVYILIPVCLLAFTTYKIFKTGGPVDDPELLVEDFYATKHGSADQSGKINASVLKDPYYVLQNDQVKAILEKTADRITCFPNTKMIDYTLCHYPGDKHGSDVEKFGYNLNEAKRFSELLNRLPHAGIIDIGANIGTLSLPIMMQMRGTRPFLMIEPNSNNIAPLVTGIYKNKMEKSRWAIIPRAMWNVSDLEANIVQWDFTSNGHLELLNNNPNIHNLPNGYHNFKQLPAKTATMDSHILPVAKALGITSAILKIDIEGSECMAFSKAENLLAQIYIPYIHMEYWPAYKMQDDWSCVRRMIKTLADFGYRPFKGDSGWTANDMLDVKRYQHWTDLDIFWKKML